MDIAAKEPKKSGKYEDYQLKDAAETVQKAHEIMADPALMKAIQPLLDKKVKAIRSLADLRKLGNAKAEAKDEAKEDPKEEAAESSEEEASEND